MIRVDTVYQRVLALANKEQRGYITPQEYNLFACQAQLEIIEQYFYDVNRISRFHGKDTEYSDMLNLLNEKISHISTSTSVTGSTEVSGSNTAVFTDTRADASAYTASGIPETSDQPTTIQNYYLHRINGVDNTFTNPLFIDGSNDIKEFVEGTFESLLQEWIRYTAADSPNNHTITYNFNGSGNNRGSGMGDTRLNGSGNYQTRFINTNDYRAQEFPNGSATTVNTHYLKINKV